MRERDKKQAGLKWPLKNAIIESDVPLRKEIIESCSEFYGVTVQLNISRWIKVDPIVLPKFRLHGKIGCKRKPYPCSYSIQDNRK